MARPLYADFVGEAPDFLNPFSNPRPQSSVIRHLSSDPGAGSSVRFSPSIN